MKIMYACTVKYIITVSAVAGSAGVKNACKVCVGVKYYIQVCCPILLSCAGVMFVRVDLVRLQVPCHLQVFLYYPDCHLVSPPSHPLAWSCVKSIPCIPNHHFILDMFTSDREGTQEFYSRFFTLPFLSFSGGVGGGGRA